MTVTVTLNSINIIIKHIYYIQTDELFVICAITQLLYFIYYDIYYISLVSYISEIINFTDLKQNQKFCTHLILPSVFFNYTEKIGNSEHITSSVIGEKKVI